jgi:hypothetical protein
MDQAAYVEGWGMAKKNLAPGTVARHQAHVARLFA